MPRSLRVFDVFVASPADVSEERDYLEEAIRELNQTWQRRLGVLLNLIRWETSVYPGFGEDAQDVVSKALPKKVDIFVGILWTRIGTPTKRAQSGTLEEFETAYAQWQEDPDSIRLLVYFKKSVPDALDKIDPEQLSKVRNFEKSLPARGGLSWVFDTAEEFRASVRKHLSLAVQDLAGKPEREPPTDSLGRVVDVSAALEREGEAEDPDDHEGLFELVDNWGEGMEVVVAITGKFTGTFERLTNSMGRGTEELKGIDVKTDRTAAKRVVNSIADRLEFLAEVLSTDTPVLEEAFRESIGSLDKAIQIAPDFGKEGVDSIYESRTGLASLKAAIDGSMDTMESMKKTIVGLPRVTTRFNRAKRNAVSSIENLFRTLRSASMQIGSSLELLERLHGGS